MTQKVFFDKPRVGAPSPTWTSQAVTLDPCILDSTQCSAMEVNNNNNIRYSPNLFSTEDKTEELTPHDTSDAHADVDAENTTVLSQKKYSIKMVRFFKRELHKITGNFPRSLWNLFVTVLRKTLLKRKFNVDGVKVHDLLFICPLTTLFLAKQFTQNSCSQCCIRAESGQEDSLVQQENTT